MKKISLCTLYLLFSVYWVKSPTLVSADDAPSQNDNKIEGEEKIENNSKEGKGKKAFMKKL